MRALRTFTTVDVTESNKEREPSSIEASQASQMTDSVPNITTKNNGLKTSRGQPKKESGNFPTKTGLDADLVNIESGPVTRSKGRALASQQSQQQSDEIVIDPKEGVMAS